MIRAFETWTHHHDITSVLGREEAPVDPPVLRTMAELAIQTLPIALAAKGYDYPGRTARVVLTGPGGGDWTIVCGAPDTVGPVPDVVLRAPVVEFCRRFADRLAVDAVPFEVEGDADLARALVDCAPAFAGCDWPRRRAPTSARSALVLATPAAASPAGASPSAPATLLASICFSISAISATFASICASASSGASLRFCATTSAPISWQRSLIFFWRFAVFQLLLADRGRVLGLIGGLAGRVLDLVEESHRRTSRTGNGQNGRTRRDYCCPITCGA